MKIVLWLLVLLEWWTVQGASVEEPFLTYWHNWADDSGETHFTLCNLTSGWVRRAFGPDQPPIYTNTFPFNTSLTYFYAPPLWNPPTFYTNPAVQFGVWFAGEMKFEVTDGTVVMIKPGVLYFGDDLNSKGHHSQNVANVPAYSAMIRIEGPTGKGPCWIN